MKRLFVAAAFILLCVSCPTSAFARYNVKKYPKKETTVDMKSMNHVCMGWMDLNVGRWAALGYDTKKEWSDLIDSLNEGFVTDLPGTYLAGHTVTGAKNIDDVSMEGCDLYVKFTDVNVDYDNYHLILGIHFIDPKTGNEIGAIPARPYFGDDWGLRGYLSYALKEISKKLSVEITGQPYKGK